MHQVLGIETDLGKKDSGISGKNCLAILLIVTLKRTLLQPWVPETPVENWIQNC